MTSFAIMLTLYPKSLQLDHHPKFIININKGNRSVPTIIFPDGTVLIEPNWEELRAKMSGR